MPVPTIVAVALLFIMLPGLKRIAQLEMEKWLIIK